MSDIKELTLAEVTAHNTKKDLYMVIHDKVYDCTSFVDEHPYVPPTFLAPCPLSNTLLPQRETCDRSFLLIASVCPYRKI